MNGIMTLQTQYKQYALRPEVSTPVHREVEFTWWHIQTHRQHTHIANSRLNRPKGRFNEKLTWFQLGNATKSLMGFSTHPVSVILMVWYLIFFLICSSQTHLRGVWTPYELKKTTFELTDSLHVHCVLYTLMFDCLLGTLTAYYVLFTLTVNCERFQVARFIIAHVQPPL